MRIDFHVHTKYSPDSIINPKDLVSKACKLDILPCISDHNLIDAHTELRKYSAQFIPAEEIRTDRGDLIGLFLTQTIPKTTEFGESLDRIREQGGLAYLPHMYDRTRAGVIPDKSELKKIDIIEIFNARCLSQDYNSKAKSFARKHKKLEAVGSDSHFLFEFGTTYNELPDFDLDSPKELLKSLRKAKFVTIPAPFYVRGTTTLVKFAKKYSII
ncbi:PHP domain-containing protein [Candidatus Micrarchaeota archaeon]|nr:PHP domain-containing protein [Candidatus Micrarchaeota archaeon]